LPKYRKRTKAERQVWWESLTLEQQQAKIDYWRAEKAKSAPASSFDHRTKFPFIATIKPLDGDEFLIYVNKDDQGVFSERLF